MTNVVDVYVGYLRRKLRSEERRVQIVTIARSATASMPALSSIFPTGLRWRLTAWVAAVMLAPPP